MGQVTYTVMTQADAEKHLAPRPGEAFWCAQIRAPAGIAALLRALGATRRQVVGSILVEPTAVGAIASVPLHCLSARQVLGACLSNRQPACIS